MKSHRLIAGEEGFSLTELMVVVVIIGILALLAVPRFMSVTVKAKMTEAKTMLKQVHTLQTAYYYEQDRYGPTLEAIGFEQVTTVREGGAARYLITIVESDENGFVAFATSQVDFDKDGQMNVWSVDETGLITMHTPD